MGGLVPALAHADLDLERDRKLHNLLHFSGDQCPETIDFTFGNLKDLVTKQMEDVVLLSVPLEVQIGVGKSWDQAAH